MGIQKRAFSSIVAVGTLSVCALTSAGCDDPKEEPAPVVKAPEPPAALPAPAPAPEPEPEPRIPTKNLEDCEKGKLEFSNADVEAHIRMKAQKPEGEITTADLGRITSVNFSRTALDTLDTCMFAHMKSLKEVFLAPGKVWDLSPLTTLKNLETVRVAGNPVEDLEPLADLKKMDRLDISDTQVKDISPVANMTKLTELTLDGAPVEDISALSETPDLEMLSIKRTQIKSLDALKDNKKLKQLFIAESAIASDIAQTGTVKQNGAQIVAE